MIRVTRLDGALRTTLRVEGRLTRETVEELRMACEATLAQVTALQIDVDGLRFIDPAGVALLKAMERRGAGIAAAGGFVAAALREEPGGVSDAPTPDREGALVARLRRGDPDAFETLVRRYGGRMLAVARRMMRNEDDARDVVQEAFLSAVRAIETFTGGARLSTWLHRVVVNAALMRLRSRRRRPEEAIDDLLPRFREDGHWAEAPGAFETGAEALLERRDARDAVRRAIDRLPETYRRVVVLRDIEDRDTDEAAALLGITGNAVKIRLHRARQALRALLVEELAGTPGGRSTRRPARDRAAAAGAAGR